MPWVIGPAIVGSALIGSQAAGQAAGAQSNASAAAVAEQQREFNIQNKNAMPYTIAGTNAMNQLQQLLGLKSGSPSKSVNGTILPHDQFDAQAYLDAYPDVANSGWSADPYGHYVQEAQASGAPRTAFQLAPVGGPGAPGPSGAPLSRNFSVSDFWNDPVVQLGYQSGLDLGTKALKNRAPLTTGLDSGAGLKELTQFGTDYSGRQAGDSKARFIGDQTNLYNRLAGVAGLGQQSANTTAQVGMNTATNIGNTMTAQGNAQGAAQIAGANAWGGGLNSIANMWNQQQMLNALKGGGNSSPWTPKSAFSGFSGGDQ